MNKYEGSKRQKLEYLLDEFYYFPKDLLKHLYLATYWEHIKLSTVKRIKTRYMNTQFAKYPIEGQYYNVVRFGQNDYESVSPFEEFKVIDTLVDQELFTQIYTLRTQSGDVILAPSNTLYKHIPTPDWTVRLGRFISNLF